jgi:hypothetical protein
LFKIPYLDGKRYECVQLARGHGRGVNCLMAVADPVGGGKKPVPVPAQPHLLTTEV